MPLRNARLQVDGEDDERREAEHEEQLRQIEQSPLRAAHELDELVEGQRPEPHRRPQEHRDAGPVEARPDDRRVVVPVGRPDRAGLSQRQHQRRAVGEGAEHVDEQEGDADGAGHEPLPGGYAQYPASPAGPASRAARRADRAADGARRLAIGVRASAPRVYSPPVRRAVGRNVPRKDSHAKVIGAAHYVDDLRVPGLLFGATVRSTIPRGRITARHVPRRRGLVSADFRDIPGGTASRSSNEDQPCLVETRSTTRRADAPAGARRPRPLATAVVRRARRDRRPALVFDPARR